MQDRVHVENIKHLQKVLENIQLTGTSRIKALADIQHQRVGDIDSSTIYFNLS